MAEDELSPLDKLLLAVSAPDPPKNPTKTDEQTSTLRLNEDEFFLAKIAADDLKALENPPNFQQLKKIDLNTPSTSKNNSQSTGANKSTSENKSQTKNKLSLIHSGDTDSSDDESNRNFENANLNEYGKEIKHLLPEIKDKDFNGTFSKSWKPKRDAPSAKAIPPLKFGLPPVQKSPKILDENVLQDPFFGIRISKPLISSAVLEERMNGRAAVSMFRVKNFLAQNGQTQDWVIAGCIVQKTSARTSQSGNQYIIWTLSDLQNDLQTVSMFLFKNAYKELWKTSVGTVVGVLNPSILDNREGSRHQATLSVDNAQRVMIFGQSKDYGLCKSRKKDGEPCTAFVNTNRCSYCLFHVKQEYQKCSLRSDCQSIGGGLTALRNKVLGKNEVFYAGKSYMAIPARKNKRLVERDNKRLSDLMNGGLVTSAVPIQRQKKKGAASSLEVSRAQRMKDLQLLQKLNGSSDVLAGLESRKNCDLDDISAEVTLEESRQTALDVIAKLKAKNNQNIDPKVSDPYKSSSSTSSTSIKTSTSSLETSSTTTSLETLSTTTSLETSTTILSTASLKTPELNKTNKPNESNLIDRSKLKILKDLDAASLTPTRASLKTSSTTSSTASLKTPEPNKTNKLNESNLIDPSKLKILKDLDIASLSPTTASLKTSSSTSATASLKTPQPNKTNNPNESNLIDPSNSKILKDLHASSSKTSSTSSTTASSKTPQPNKLIKPIDSNLIDPSKLKLFKDLHASPGPKLSQNAVIDLNSPLPNRAKLKALNWVQKNGPINKSNPSGAQKSGVKRFLENAETPGVKPKKSKLEERAQFSDRFRKIMELTSAHSDLLEQRDLEEQEKYFNKLEQREKMEEKMMTTFKVQCKAVKCLVCKYTSFSAAAKCKQEKHALKVFDAIKRFFKCGNCGNRTVSLDVYPIFSCKNCASTKWERATMMKEKIVKIGDGLSIRGGEQAFVNSVVTDANINLLMPDE